MCSGTGECRRGVASIVPEAGTCSFEAVVEPHLRLVALRSCTRCAARSTRWKFAPDRRKAGHQAACVTVDSPAGGWRERNLRNQSDPDVRMISVATRRRADQSRTMSGQLLNFRVVLKIRATDASGRWRKTQSSRYPGVRFRSQGRVRAVSIACRVIRS
ncbi:alpha-hydroxy-acid oxidizing protein [Pseudonocardia xinjiangensis]|uniref:alpha-hydroxy-acid oxidizing protein n=1 Tax=Pseudonocardia xinjiangensis TaxID=75289 RepID=UPI003D8C641E